VKYWVNSHKGLNYDFDNKPIYELNSWLYGQGRKNYVSREDLIYRIKISSSFKKTKSKLPAILNVGSFKHIQLQPPQFCPGCLSDFEPYFRFEWRYILIFACDRCNCFLETSCVKCKNPIQLMRLKLIEGNNFNKINNCAFCNFPLGETKSKALNQHQKELNTSLRNILGLNPHFNVKVHIVTLIIDLCNYLCTNDKIATFIRKYFNLKEPKNKFQYLDTLERYNVLNCAWVWLKDFTFITSFFNEELNLNHKYWSSKIYIPNINQVMHCSL
jgi:hypothetical protein